MLDLTFGEQVKIILKRKGVTIKELAEMIEERTGKKMSRQNLTQRLGRDNFQEQDMRMIAEILDCSFQLSILGEARQSENTDEESVPVTEAELLYLEKKKRKKPRHPVERDITIGELVDLNRGLDQLIEEKEELLGEAIALDAARSDTEPAEETPQEHPAKKTKGSWRDFFQKRSRKESKETTAPKEAEQQTVSPAAAREEVKVQEEPEEDLEKGEINPYTGHEYASNTVRMHPKRIGYVQVYDKSSHQWTDMTEWAFLGYQERKKALLGKDYEPPIYLD